MSVLDFSASFSLGRYRDQIDATDPLPMVGQVVRSVGLLVESRGPRVRVGELCEIVSRDGAPPLLLEVVGFRDSLLQSVPLGSTTGIRPGDRIVSRGRPAAVPVGDALLIAFYKLAQGASKDLKVVLGGEGADEAFAGYSFQGVIGKVNKVRALAPLAALAFEVTPHALLNQFFVFPADLGSQGKKRVIDFLRHYNRRDLNHNFNALRTLWSMDERRDVYAPEFKARASNAWMANEREQDKRGPFLDRLLKLQYDEWLQDWALIRQDKNTMAHSLEYRLPFLDHRLIELAFTMPAHLKNNGREDKIIERRLADKVFPPHIARRKKIPFYLPVEYFLDQPQFKALVADTLNETAVKKRGYFDPKQVTRLVDQMRTTREFIFCKQVVSLVILELWHRVFIDRSYRFDSPA